MDIIQVLANSVDLILSGVLVCLLVVVYLLDKRLDQVEKVASVRDFLKMQANKRKKKK